MPIKSEHLDELLSGYEKPEDLVGENGLFKQLKKALLERALGAEFSATRRAIRPGAATVIIATAAIPRPC
jgi:CRP-like cAMP-binding protein